MELIIFLLLSLLLSSFLSTVALLKLCHTIHAELKR